MAGVCKKPANSRLDALLNYTLSAVQPHVKITNVQHRHRKSILPLGTAAETLQPQVLLNPALTIDPGGSLTPVRCCLVPTQATMVHGSDVEISKLCSS